MQNIKKYFLTLALLLTAVGGAWAQTAFGVKEITADMLPASWSTDNSAVTADDLAKFGFMEVTKDVAKTWTGAPQQGTVRLIYTLCESVNWVKGEGGYVSSYNSRKTFYSCLDGQRIFITTELTEWDLTSQDGKTWTLAKMPGSNVELQVEYYPESNLFLGKEALADKANISVLNGETAVAFGDDGKSTATVTEGNKVTAKFTGTKKILGMKAVKKAAPAPKPIADVNTNDVGKLIGLDGYIYVTKSAATTAGTTAVAVIAYVGSETDDDTYKKGLAIALADESGTMNWSTAKTTCEGKTAVTNAKWCLPSAYQWRQMCKANGGNDDNCNGLFTTITTHEGTAWQSVKYWTSTEPASGYKSYFKPSVDGSGALAIMMDDNPNNSYYVRACLVF